MEKFKQTKYRKNRFGLYIAVLLLIFSLTLTGCSLQGLLGNKKKSTSSSSTQDQKPVIALALDQDNPNRLLIKKGIEDMAKKANMEIKEVKSQGNSNSKGDGSEESPLKGAKLLVYQGSDNQALIQSAEKDKVPILALDKLPPGSKPAGIILPDPEETGKLMAETLLTRIKEGKVIVMQADPNDHSSQKMLAGNKQVLAKTSGIQVEVVFSPLGTESVARQTLTQILQQDGKVKGILAHTEQLAAQAHETLKQMGLEKKVFLVGGEANLESLKRIASGGQIGDVDTSPYIQGVNAFQWAQKIIKKESLEVMESVTGDQGEIPAKVIPVKQVTPENLAIIQKSYATTMSIAQKEEEQKQGGQEKQQGQSSQDNENQAQEGDQGGQDQQGKEGGQEQNKSNIPPGVKKITERVKTEITREYLDDKGNILGRETSTNQQVRTVPPEMLLQQQGQGQQQEQTQGKEGGEKKGGGKEGGGDSGGGSQ